MTSTRQGGRPAGDFGVSGHSATTQLETQDSVGGKLAQWYKNRKQRAKPKKKERNLTKGELAALMAHRPL